MNYISAFLFLLILNNICNEHVFAATINAASCDNKAGKLDVQQAVDSAVDGDVIIVPPGDCTWESSLIVSNKRLTLKGSGIDVTIIRDSPFGTSGDSLIAMMNQKKMVRITGFTFDGTNGASHTWGMININGTVQNFRIDHNKFNNVSKRGITIGGKGYGVIDHNQFVKSTSNPAQSISIIHDGDAAWSRPLSLGSASAVYIEDNTFDYTGTFADGALDAYSGARYVFRYNTVNGTMLGHHGLDSGRYRSTHSYEIYNNTFNHTGTSIFCTFFSRGGTGVIFNNNVPSGYNGFVCLANYRSCGAYDPWGQCNGTSGIDGNTPGMYGYPCADQIGRTTGQISSPLYVWNNNFKGGAGIAGVADALCPTSTVNMTTHVKEGRDFFNGTAKPGYAPYKYPHPLTDDSVPKLDVIQ